MNKDRLRRRLKLERQTMIAADAAAKSQKIADQLEKQVNWTSVASAHIYQSVADWQEVDTRSIIDSMRQQKVEVEVALPDKGQPIPSKNFDMIIAPVLGFDKECNRLGLGGGWYDRFLSSQPQAKKIGLAYQSAFIPGGLTRETHDIQLDMIITEEGVIKR